MWHFGGGCLLQDEAEDFFPIHRLPSLLIEVNDEHKLHTFYEKRVATEVAAEALGEEWKGRVFPISSGNNKQGFPHESQCLDLWPCHLLLSKGHSCYRPRSIGEKKYESLQGCIMNANLSVLTLAIVKLGGKYIPGLTDIILPCGMGPQRSSRIRKLFHLSREDVC